MRSKKCSGKVHLSTTSREGKILILKTASAGEALGLSASVSGVGYETTAETATPCHLSFVDRKRFWKSCRSSPRLACVLLNALAATISRRIAIFTIWS
jgi:CRP-like cAMP-binding protein